MGVEAVHGCELEVIKYLQLIRNPVLDPLMIFLNFIDTIPFYTLLVTCIWYLYDQKCGLHLLCLLVLSTVVNSDLKEIFSLPRPLVLDPDVGMVKALGFGFPSGAAQTMIALFGFLALTVHKKWFWAFSVCVVLLISFSRVYLGIHFPSDIVGGWVIGAAVLGAFYGALPYIESLIDGQPKMTLLYLSVIVTLIISFLSINDKVLKVVFLGLGGSVGYIITPPLPGVSRWAERVIRLATAVAGVCVIVYVAMMVLPFFAPMKMAFSFIEEVFFFLSGLWLAVGGSLVVRKA